MQQRGVHEKGGLLMGLGTFANPVSPSSAAQQADREWYAAGSLHAHV